MIRNLTHDLRTPLNGNMGLIKCAMNILGKESEISQEYL